MINKVILVGHVGIDPEIRNHNGSKVAKIRMATTERWKDQSGEPRENTEWHNVVAFGRKAEVIEQYIRKGSKVYVEGSIHYSSYEKDGKTYYSTDILAAEIRMLDGNNNN